MQEQDISIDINTNKLFEWLINRRHCKREWQDSIGIIRDKKNKAIQDMPANEELSKILSGTYISYFHCQKIQEIIKNSELNERKGFFRHTGERTKVWQEIISLYEKDNVYLAETAQLIIQNINYEIPNVKKQIQKLDQIQNEFEKKEVEYKKLENLAHTEFNNLCKQLGISGIKIKRELMEKLQELPDIYDKLAKKMKALDNVVEFYNAFVEFTLGHQHNGGCVPMIKYIIDKGNTTTYEWTYGECPLSITEPNFNFNSNDDEEDNDEQNNTIDFGGSNNEIDFSSLNLDAEIDFGNENQLDTEGEIDWGGIAEDAEPPAEIIDFDISLEESGIVVEDVGNDGGNATGSQALTILDNIETRNDVINQLFELEAFLKLRLYEFKSNNSNRNIMEMSHLQESSILQVSTLDSTQNMLDNVQLILSEMVVDSKLQHLHNIKHYPKYVDIFTANLKKKKAVIKKMELLQQKMRDKQEETREQVVKLKPLLKLMIKNTKDLQTEIEKEISKMYKNRKVYLTGVINAL